MVSKTQDKLATSDYDCIIMSHSQFEKIPISAERKERMLNEQIEEIGYAIDEMKSLGMKYKAIRDGYQIKIEYTKVDPNFLLLYCQKTF